MKQSVPMDREAARRWLAGLLAQRKLGFFARMATRAEIGLGRWVARCTTLSRHGRRAFNRRLAPALLGASLLGTMVAMPSTVSAASITVGSATAVANDGACSLSEAILNANSDSRVYTSAGECAAGSGDDTINMTADVTLTASRGYYVYADTGLAVVSTPITIEGNGHTISRSSAAPDFRILAVDYTGDLTLNEVTVSGGALVGFVGGGGIANYGALTLNDSVVSDNYAYFYGGGILNYSVLTLNRSTITSNATYRSGGGISEGTTILNDSEISWNSAGGRGGGIFTSGGVYSTNSTISHNDAGRGGGLSVWRGRLELTDSTVAANSANQYGGGIEKRYGNFAITRSTISSNSTTDTGGGLLAKHVADGEVTNSTFSGNVAGGKGGGIYIIGELRLNNTTISGNSSGADGGGIYNVAVTDAYQSIIAGNTAAGQGVEVFNSNLGFFQVGHQNVLGHSGLTNNAAFRGFTPSAAYDVTATSDGSDPTALSAIIGPLADNGGPTLTHALISGSPAIDLAYVYMCAYQLGYVDQRGEPRNVDGDGSPSLYDCDAGSIEYQVAAGGGETLYISSRTPATLGGIRVRPQDVVAQNLTTGNWFMHFDGSDVGITRPLGSFTHLSDGSLLLALAGNQRLPGVGLVTPNDIVRFTPSSLGETTSGVFDLYFDGSDVGLNGPAEKIDALDSLDSGQLLISTVGNASVPMGGGANDRVQDEDLLAFSPTSTGTHTDGTWAVYLDGSTVPGLAAEDVIAAHVDEGNGDIYLAMIDDFNVGGIRGNGRDIVRLSPSGSGHSAGFFWRGSDYGISIKFSGIDMP